MKTNIVKKVMRILKPPAPPKQCEVSLTKALEDNLAICLREEFRL